MVRKRWTYVEVKAYFEERGCELISDEYRNSNEILDYICGDCGNTTTTRFSNFKKGHRCKNCRTKQVADSRRLTYEEVQKTFEDGGCTLLSEVYINSMTPLEYACSCGNKSKILLGNFKKGSRCMECGIKKLRGENNYQWNPERIAMGRNTPEYRAWRTNVLKRDDYSCQKCGTYHWAMVAHHVVNFGESETLRYDEDNGISLCRSCHNDFHVRFGFTNNDGSQLMEFLSDMSDIDPWFAGECFD